MAYSKTTWANGDTITAEKLNNLENGVEAAGSLIVTLTNDDDTWTSDVEPADIYAAYSANKGVSFHIIADYDIDYMADIFTAGSDGDNIYIMASSSVLLDDSSLGYVMVLYQGQEDGWSVSVPENLIDITHAPYEVEGTPGEDAETHKITVTLNKTAADIWEAAEAGKQLKVTVENVPAGEAGTSTITMIVPIEIFQIVSEGDTYYMIKARIDVSGDDVLFVGDNLSPSDTVVLTAAASS